MGEPIISPWFIYLALKLDCFRGFMVCLSLCYPVFAVLYIVLMGEVDINYDFKRAIKKALNIGVVLVPLSMLIAFFTPDTKTLVAMYVANKTTVANVQALGNAVDIVADKSVEKIVKVIESIKKSSNKE